MSPKYLGKPSLKNRATVIRRNAWGQMEQRSQYVKPVVRVRVLLWAGAKDTSFDPILAKWWIIRAWETRGVRCCRSYRGCRALLSRSLGRRSQYALTRLVSLDRYGKNIRLYLGSEYISNSFTRSLGCGHGHVCIGMYKVQKSYSVAYKILANLRCSCNRIIVLISYCTWAKQRKGDWPQPCLALDTSYIWK